MKETSGVRDNRNIAYATTIDIHNKGCKIDMRQKMINLFTREWSKVVFKKESERNIRKNESEKMTLIFTLE